MVTYRTDIRSNYFAFSDLTDIYNVIEHIYKIENDYNLTHHIELEEENDDDDDDDDYYDDD